MAGRPHSRRGLQIGAWGRGGLCVERNQVCLVNDLHKVSMELQHFVGVGGKSEDKLLGSCLSPGPVGGWSL